LSTSRKAQTGALPLKLPRKKITGLDACFASDRMFR